MVKHQLLWFRNLTLKWHLTKTVVFQIKNHLSQMCPKLKFWHGRGVKDFKLNRSVQTKEIWLRNEKMWQLKVFILFYSLYRATFKIITSWIFKLSSHASLKVRNSRVNRRPIWIVCKKLSKVELACLSCWELSKLWHCHWLELQIGSVGEWGATCPLSVQFLLQNNWVCHLWVVRSFES